MEQLTLKKVEGFGIESSKAKQIKNVFEPMVVMLEGFEDRFNEIIEKEQSIEIIPDAKRLRLDISQVRIKTDKLRVEQKAEYLRAGKAIDGVANILKYAVIDKEEKLKSIEEHFERIEKEKTERLHNERLSKVEKYGVSGEHIDLGNMPNDVWTNFFQGSKTAHENKIKAEKKTEVDRKKKEKAQRERQKKLEQENLVLQERLQQEEKQAGIIHNRIDLMSEIDQLVEWNHVKDLTDEQFQKLYQEAKKIFDSIAKQREEDERLKMIQEQNLKEENRKQFERLQAKVKKEKEAKQKIEQELEAKKQAELEAIAEQKAKQQKEAKEKRQLELAPDKQKIEMYVDALLTLPMPEVQSKSAESLLKNINQLLNKIDNYTNYIIKEL